METDDRPRPSTAETLSAVYGDRWIIWREVFGDGSHGAWLATQDGREVPLRADSIDALAELLDAAEGSG